MTEVSLIVGDSAALARQLREHDLPGQRTKTAITRLRRERRSRREDPADAGAQPDVHARLLVRLVERFSAEIVRRGGETDIADKNRVIPLTVADRADRMVLLHARGWRYYSSRTPSRYATLSYLCGRDDNGDFAVRVPGTVTTVREALAWLTPATVQEARARGRQVLRQGDVYAVETTRRHAAGTGWVSDTHHYDAETGVLSHHPEDGHAHRDLRVPFPARFVTQSPYGMVRGRGRAAGGND